MHYKMKKKFRYKSDIIITLIVLILLFTGLFPKQKSGIDELNARNYIKNPHEKRGDSDMLKVALSPYISPLNPFYESTKEVSLISKLVHRSLFDKNEQGMYEGDIADHYWIDNEGKTIAIVLKKDQYFNDGTPITAKHVSNTFRVLADPKYTGSKSKYVELLEGYYDYTKGLDASKLGIEVEGDYFIKFHFNVATKDSFDIFDFPIVNLNEFGFSYGQIEGLKNYKFTSGAGLYDVHEEAPNQFILEKKVEVDIPENISITLVPYFTAIDQYSSGLFDILYKYDKDIDRVEGLTKRQLQYSYMIENQGSEYMMLGFDLEEGLFKDKDFRIALKNIDLANILGFGEKQKIDTGIYENSRLYLEDDVYRPKFSISELLKTKSIDRKIKFAVYENLYNLRENEAKIIETFEQEGLKVEIVFLNDSQMFDVLDGKVSYDLFMAQRNMFVIPSVVNQHIYSHTNEISRYSLKDRDMIVKLEWIATAFGQDNYEFAVTEWQQWFYENIPYIPLVSNRQISIINKRIEGLEFNEFTGLYNINNLIKINDILK